MRIMSICLAFALIISFAVKNSDLVTAQTQTEAQSPAKAEPPAQAQDEKKTAPAGLDQPPLDYLKTAEQGKLNNPYTDNAEAIEQGRHFYLSYSCNGCHGGTGGGGICPPLSNEVWIYGSDDDTLFRLITLGTDALTAAGYSRKRFEKVKGPMPPFGEIIHNTDELWKIIAFVRTTYRGDPSKRDW
jgi:mono/diheme cytochrome c family protein